MPVTLPRPTRVLYAGVALFIALAAFTARSIWVAWRDRSGEARADAVFDLVGQRLPSRPTDAPGAMAWLRLQLERYGDHLESPDRTAMYRHFAAAGDRVPDELRDVDDALAAADVATRVPSMRLLAPPAGGDLTSLRRERLVDLDGERFAVTRRRGLDTPALSDDSSSNRFLQAVVPRLSAARRGVDAILARRPLPLVPGATPPRPVRVYAVGEDGTLVSRPWADNAGDRQAVDREIALLSARPAQPTFAPDPFFFRFEATGARPRRDAAYSGFYLDLGGRGLVSTLMRPIVTPGGDHGVVAIDLAFDVDWTAFAASVPAPVESVAVSVRDRVAPFWSAIERMMPPGAGGGVRAAVGELARRDAPESIDDRPPLRQTPVEPAGAVAAFQMSDEIWLVMFFPKRAPAFPIAAVALLGGLLALLLGGFEVNRRRAERERLKAERALAEKQNLLNTMQVPLVVVDPNSDAIVSANRAADAIGIRAGGRFADVVWPDERSRAYYERMQTASGEPRRAYGMPVAVRDEGGEVAARYALVRSVAVTAPIEALAADERHRLGVLFVLDPDTDLALFTEDLERQVRRDERRRLAGLLSHGVDTLARVLEHTLSGAATPSPAFAAWLAEYLERRISVAAWLLDHWDAAPPLPPDTIVDHAQFAAIVDRWQAILDVVRSDRELRARLHWDNGVLASPGTGPVLDVHVEWPETMQFTTPVRGAFGLFAGEAIANAIRHGAPGSQPQVRVTCDRVRRELLFEVENDTADRSPAAHGDAYGGLAMLQTIARLCGWHPPEFVAAPGRFRASWVVPVSERPARGAD